MPKDIKKYQFPKNTKTLIQTIRTEIETHTRLAKEAVQSQKLKLHYAIGNHIKTHILNHKEKSDYGDLLFDHLSAEIGMSKRDLYYSVQYFELNPSIVQTSAQLSWSHLKEVLTLETPKKQTQLIKKIISKNLSVRDVKALIKNTAALPPASKNPQKTVTAPQDRGAPYTYRIQKNEAGILQIDLGFGIRIESADQTLSVDSVVKSEKDDILYHFNYLKNHTSPHYIYKAVVKEVIDGDTLWVTLALGFKIEVTMKVRLRGIDTAANGTPTGDATTAFVRETLKNCQFVAIKTYWRDKYKRYLADVFYAENETDLERVISNGTFLNAEIEGLGK